jgi:hypothetical protein
MELKKGDVLVSNGSQLTKGVKCKVIDVLPKDIVLSCEDNNYNYYFNSDEILNFFYLEKQEFEVPKHYNNSKGTLYKVAEERGWNTYLFDIVKRLERANKKGEFENDLNKSKLVIDLWLKEQK